jgi:adenine deaminase
MYVLLREGSACHDLRNLLAGVTEHNSRMCLFCTDDRQPRSILTEGHIDNHLRIAVQEGLNPLTAIRMATLNAAECYRLHDRGAIVPGRRADLVLVEDLCDFRIDQVWCKGKPYVEDTAFTVNPIAPAVAGRMDIGDFTSDKLVLHLRSPQVRFIGMLAESVVTNAGTTTVTLDSAGTYVNDPNQDIVKLAVIERHRGTGNVGLALLGGYGLHDGAIATTIAHDSHNVIVAGDNDPDMVKAVEVLVELGGGIVMVRRGEVLDVLPLPIAGLMTNLGGAHVDEKFGRMHNVASQELGIHAGLDPFMSLSFMALPVIPHLKVTDMGLFDVDTFSFVPLEI